MGELNELRGLLDRTEGLRLDGAAYVADFEERFWRIGPDGFWKLECLQSYDETGFPSWEAFRRGDWAEALRLVEQSRPEIERQSAALAAAGIRHHRARVVVEPVSPYVQWELHVLRAKDQRGEHVAVLTVDRAAALVGAGPLPDLVVLGDEAVYEVHYTAAGVPDGATRYREDEVIRRARDFVRLLHRAGEGLAAYFPREIAGLGAPRP
ncbi:DUF6879 family protein [Streptacidiphilus anmyonensis]|uniref:DUF6879 family protein n=1 Tax=Streptacidiphilus anmyonensis TaxID=405782 RepID=UPI0005A9BF3A|nr:DUF6879 family protein [Streptacidiphilus anmyonensis]